MATFIDGVNRLLRINNTIKGDDDNITTFSDTQHASDISLAQIAIQDELGEIVSERLIPYERASDSITLVTNTRAYALNTNFIRFFGHPSFYDSTDNTRIFEYPGGEKSLMNHDYPYKTTQGAPNFWYWENATTLQVAFYNVPNSTFNGRSLSYDYEKTVMVTNSTDTLPFIKTEEYHAFVSCAARRFYFMLSSQPMGLLTNDATYNNAKARLYAFLRQDDPDKYYGYTYG